MTNHKQKRVVALYLEADSKGSISICKGDFEVTKETPKMIYVAEDPRNSNSSELLHYKSQFRKADLPEHPSICTDSRYIRFGVIDVCHVDDVDSTMGKLTKELINRMEDELNSRSELLSKWIASIV